jgi:rod shape-determining protein MreC
VRDHDRRSSGKVLALLLLACATLITLDARGGASSPVEPVRALAGEVLGPAEEVTASVVRPLRSVPAFLRTTDALRSDVARLEAQNAVLEGQLATSAVDRNRAAELDGLMRASRSTGYAMVPARVVAMGPAQSFSSAVTIDAGTSSGVRPDMTVVNHDGLVGRVLRAGRSSATVLLAVDAESVVGGRLGSTMEIGFLRGRGVVGEPGRLDLDLVDNAVTPAEGDVIVTWGSQGGRPYVPGVPVGRVLSVYSSPRELSKQAVIEPLVDFTSLDLVGVVVKDDAGGDRTLVRPGSRTAAGAPVEQGVPQWGER